LQPVRGSDEVAEGRRGGNDETRARLGCRWTNGERSPDTEEAGQATESSFQVALLHGKRCVLAGDPYQLPHSVIRDKAERPRMGSSLLDRIFKQKGLHDSAVRMLTPLVIVNTADGDCDEDRGDEELEESSTGMDVQTSRRNRAGADIIGEYLARIHLVRNIGGRHGDNIASIRPGRAASLPKLRI